jgi:hypothetical protein
MNKSLGCSYRAVGGRCNHRHFIGGGNAHTKSGGKKSRYVQAMTRRFRKASKYIIWPTGESPPILKRDLDFPGEKVIITCLSVQTKNLSAVRGRPWSDALAVCSSLPRESIYAIVYKKPGRWRARYNAKGQASFADLAPTGSQLILS